jgi:hypothetical protein
VPCFCYVVLCHTDAPHVLHLARRIRELSPGSSVVLRHAQGEGFLTAADAASVGASVLRSEVQVEWGLWSLTGAALEALEHARDTTGADWFVLLSGQDHPVRDLRAWEAELVASGAGATYRHFEPRDQDWQYRWRVLRLPRQLTGLPRPLTHLLERVWRRLGSPVLEPVVKFYRLGNRSSTWGFAVRRPRTVLTGPPLRVPTGSFWLTVSRPALDRLLDRHHGDEGLRDWFAPTLITDEHYLQALLVDDPQTVVADVVSTWQHVPVGDWNAAPLTPEQVELAAATGAAFARKVAGPRAEEVRARADALIGSHRALEVPEAVKRGA